MSHPHRAIRFGRVLGPSKDKGPHKQVKVRSNGREFRAKVWEPYGVSGNPVTDSECLILVPEGDEGKAVDGSIHLNERGWLHRASNWLLIDHTSSRQDCPDRGPV
jgi:hypothetical protein